MAITERYVTVTGAGAHDGTSEGNAFTWAEMITDINTPRVGYRYNVKAGTYANGTTGTTLTGDGTTTSPNIIEGYNTSAGDLRSNGRSSGGALNTTNFPVISYTGATAKFTASGANYLVLRCLSITAAANTATCVIGDGIVMQRCSVSATGGNASSQAINAANSTEMFAIEDCDCITAVSGATSAVNISNIGTAGIYGCRIKCPNGAAIATSVSLRIIGNTLYESVNGIAVTATNVRVVIIGNTIVNNTGDGIDIVTSTTVPHVIIGNHITGNGGWGIDFNTSTCQKILGWNRFRDNTSGAVNGGGDWETGTSVFNVTSDDTDAIDFTDQANDDYSLLNNAPAILSGIGYRNPIGAHGAGSFSVSGGGAYVIGG